MKKSINGWTFTPDQPLPEIVTALRAAGFDAFEPAIGHNDGVPLDGDESDFKRAADVIRDAGLEIASTACGDFWQSNYTANDPAVRKAAHELTIRLLDRAAWLGAGALLVVPGMVTHFERPAELVTPYSEALFRAVDGLTALLPEAESRGVVIAVENVWNGMLQSPVEFADFIDRINSPWVQAYFDVGNALRFGIPEDWINTLAQRIERIHLKDFKTLVGNIDGFCPLGDGDVNWPNVMAALKTTNYTGPLTYEGPGDPADIAQRISRIITAS